MRIDGSFPSFSTQSMRNRIVTKSCSITAFGKDFKGILHICGCPLNENSIRSMSMMQNVDLLVSHDDASRREI